MICPRCQKTLETGTYGEITLQRCSQCNGIMLPQPSLVQLLTTIYANLDVTISADSHIEKAPDPHSAIRCPGCTRPMENFGYMGSDVARIDACQVCRSLWIDQAELASMSLLHARNQMRQLQRGAAARTAESESRDVVAQILFRRAASDAFLTGYMLG